MYRQFNHPQRAMTLVEIMVAIGIAAVVLGGVVATFSRVTSSVTNASRAADITVTNRSVADLLERDFANAGRGISDLNALNMHFAFSSSFVTGTLNEEHLYPIAGLEHDGTAYSDITLQWFDYDLSEPNRNLTFVADFPSGSAWDDLGNYSEPVTLLANDNTTLAQIQSGDIFVFYKYGIFRVNQEDIAQDGIWNSNIEDPDEPGRPLNDAVILQVGELSSVSTSLSVTGITYARTIQTYKSDQIFSNDLNGNASQTIFTPYNAALGVSLDDDLRMPAGTFLARRLGHASSFNRVRYYVPPNSRTLIRSHNGNEEVVASNVSRFEVRVGLDTPKGNPTAFGSDDMDGYVSVNETNRWTRDLTDSGLSIQQYKILLGRHALAAEVAFSIESLEKDRGDSAAGGTGGTKVRSFVQHYRLWNSTLPTINF